ncbi:TPA: hypothetical protein JG825_003455 [Vibrio parahaemolyticus]|nr:hypothetical protein [Vibrio parahaemolyticus]UPR19083.1 hypothetical protein H9J99_25905 [Vibrio parahaemolyticus]HAV1520136.1 hypothetical protein [Vibrio parahaemolyticus]HAV1539103.1 hypothetical protein [Vibrio parahaemolyticus]
MKLILSTLVFVSYLFFAPDYFAELTAQVFQLEEMIIRVLKFLIMLSGVIAFVAFTPIEWFKSARWFKWGKDMKKLKD